MTMVPIWKKCPKCHKKYSWNPDLAHFTCPYCYGLGKSSNGFLDGIFGKKKDAIYEEDKKGER